MAYIANDYAGYCSYIPHIKHTQKPNDFHSPRYTPYPALGEPFKKKKNNRPFDLAPLSRFSAHQFSPKFRDNKRERSLKLSFREASTLAHK